MTKRKYRLLDLFSGAGGAAMGYHRAGFEVVGVDIKRQLQYPFEFIRSDALNLDLDFLRSFDAIHASPPCQAYSGMTALMGIRSKQVNLSLGDKHSKLIEPVRALLARTGKPYIIENVPGAPLINPIVLCGAMFDLGVIRHRLFETNFPAEQPDHISHNSVKEKPYFACVVGMGGAWRARAGSRETEDWKKAMDIDWMERYSLTQAIPPAYTEFLGKQLIKYLETSHD